jgi:hypothetical protein
VKHQDHCDAREGTHGSHITVSKHVAPVRSHRHIYTAQGDSVRTIHLPNSITWSYPQIAYNGRRLVLVQDDQIVAFDVTGKAIDRLAGLPVGERESTWTPFLTRGGRELLLFNGRNSIYRFAMP